MTYLITSRTANGMDETLKPDNRIRHGIRFAGLMRLSRLKG